jgi:hypothetical protein
MRYFICTFDMINFGIPAESTEHIIQLSRKQNSLYETTDSDVFISLPALFRQYDTTPHGLVLKLPESTNGVTRKITLLTPKIEKDLEIPDDNVHQLPQLFSGPFIFFKGMFFNEGNMVFVLNPEKLKECGQGYIK